MKTIAGIALLLSAAAAAQGEPATKPVIAIIAQNAGTEPTDFLVPLSVIAGSGFAEVHAVAQKSGPVMLHPSGVTVELPDTIATFDAAFPGGANFVIVPAMHHPQDDEIAAWLRKQRERGATVMSVCDGASVLAHAGLLKGKTATAHWYALDDLRKGFPDTTWRNDRRYIFDGNVITTSGVSASVPATLALLEHIAGREPTLRYAATLGISDWSAEHDGARFHLSGAAMRTATVNTLAFWRRERVELNLPEGVDEASAAFLMDAYSRTYRSSVALSAPQTRTRQGLVLRSNGAKADRSVDASLAGKPLGEALDAILRQIEGDYGPATADFVALQLEYVRPALTSETPLRHPDRRK